jgi:hypothetical protein
LARAPAEVLRDTLFHSISGQLDWRRRLLVSRCWSEAEEEELQSIIKGVLQSKTEYLRHMKDRLLKIWNEGLKVRRNVRNTKPLDVHLYLHISFLNHSCRPNCMLFWDEAGNRVNLMTTLAIEGKDTELTVNYLDYNALLADKEKRGQKLDLRNLDEENHLNRWSFKCKCEVCSMKPKALEADDDKRKRADELCKKLNLEGMGRFDANLEDQAGIKAAQDEIEEVIRLLKDIRLIDYLGNAYIRAIFLFSCEESNTAEGDRKMREYRKELKTMMRDFEGIRPSLLLFADGDFQHFRRIKNHDQALIACSVHNRNNEMKVAPSVTQRYDEAKRRHPRWAKEKSDCIAIDEDIDEESSENSSSAPSEHPSDAAGKPRGVVNTRTLKERPSTTN